MTTKSGQLPLVRLEGVCHDCRHRHRIAVPPAEFAREAGEWECKHRGHDFEFYSPARHLPRGLDDRLYERLGRAPWWLDYRPNANIKLAYASSAAFTITLASLASSSTFVAGRQSTTIDNTSNLYLDYLVGGKVTTGTSPTATKEVRAYLFGSVDDTPTYPDTLGATDANVTITSTDVLAAALALFAASGTDSTSNRTYWLHPKGVAQFFAGLVPKKFGLFAVHNTGVALNATGSNHALSYTGVYSTSI